LKSLITGAEGFAGSHLADYLLRLGDEVIGLVRDASDLANLAHIRGKIRIEEADVRDSECISRVLGETRPQRIYHLAAMSSPAASLGDPRLTYDVNFGGTLNILCAWRQLEFEGRLLVVSSAEVYGLVRREELPLREDAPLQPATPYAGSKAAAELLALQFFRSYGLPVVRVRPFNHTGPRQSSTFVCSSLARQIAQADAGTQKPSIAVGNLKAQRDFTDVRDIVRGYCLLLDKGVPGDVYNLCSGRAVTIEEILGILKSFATRPVQVEVEQPRVRAQDAAIVRGDATKTQVAVGWKPEIEWNTTLRDLKLYWEGAIRSQL
jgi:GDP-4-dehydro-6-deoxy-D-mannose reductase